MNIVLITAGGSGTRMGYCVPKQFANVLGKPLIVHTLEKFEHHVGVDAIAVACLEGWENQLREMAAKYEITKLKHIVPGGATNQESIRCGVEALALHYAKDDVVLIHDAVRPMVSEEVISDCLRVVREKGNAVASLPCLEPLLIQADKDSSREAHRREGLMRAQAPQGFSMGRLAEAYREAEKRGISNCVAACELMQRLGETVYFSRSELMNIKVTTKEDISMMEKLLRHT